MPAASPLRVAVIPVTPFQQNCSLVWCADSGRGAVVDPGGDLDQIRHAITRNGVTLEKILITHGHLDHAGGAFELSERSGVPIIGPHADDAFLIEALPDHGRRYGMTHCRQFIPDRWLAQGDHVTLGDQTLEVRHCPGHTPGHVVFFHAGVKLAFVGDVLFKGSVGRSDLPRGDHATLVRSITERLWPLGDDTTFVPGHGPVSTFGQERLSNPFVGDRVLRAG